VTCDPPKELVRIVAEKIMDTLEDVWGFRIVRLNL